ncbi:energy-coupling factor transporter transmembrane protein EcfT [Microbacterium sp. CBS5P-1]|nr:energy-coupling factor transporter transmembrane component T [Microbacterium excoecariae]NHI15779.1 energy-coupling factor transporter transmembrane protein EcfT [Microbacterium excoecariae]
MSRINPVAKLAAALLIALPLVVTIDVVSGLTALVLELPLLLASGLSARSFWVRTLPVWIAAPLAALTIALYGAPAGETHARWLLVHVTDGSLELAAATLFRVLAIALPGIVLFAGVDPTDLADGLAQRARLPARFVLGALGGMRLVGLLVSDWRELETARRARGVADTGRIRRLVGMAFSLVVLAIRRGTHLATAMEARAFGADTPRTWARDSPWGWREWALVAAGLAISGIALAVTTATGHLNVVLGG